MGVLASDSAKEILEAKNPSRTFVPLIHKKKEQTRGFEIKRNDVRLREVRLSSRDSITTDICFGQPIKVTLANHQKGIVSPSISSTAFGYELTRDKKSIILKLNKQIESKKGIWPGYAILSHGNRGEYTIFLNGRSCQTNVDYARHIKIYPKASAIKTKDVLLPAENFIVNLTKARDRVNHHQIMVRRPEILPELKSVSLPFTLIIDEKRDSYDFEIYFLSSTQIQKINHRTIVDKWTSRKLKKKFERNGLNKVPISFVSEVNVNTEYIQQRGVVHLLVVDKKLDTYQHGKIDLRKALKQSKVIGISN